MSVTQVMNRYTPKSLRLVLDLFAPAEARRRGMVPGDIVSLDTIQDDSGNGNHFAQTNAALRIRLLFNTILKVWEFRGDGTQYMTGPAGLTNSPLGYVSVLLSDVPSIVQVERNFFSTADVGAANKYLMCGLNNGVPCIRQRDGATDAQDLVQGGSVPAANTITEIGYGSTGSAYKIWQDGKDKALTVVGSGTNSGDWSGDTSSRDNSAIFARVNNTALGIFAGGIVGIKVTDQETTALRRDRLRNWNRGNTAPKTTISITSPKSYQLDSALGTGTARMISEGTWLGATPGGIESRFNGGAWTAAVVTGNSWRADLGLIPAGSQGTCEARYTSDHSVSVSSVYVGVGKVVLIAYAQSNGDTPHDSPTVATHPTWRASLISFLKTFRQLVDPASDRPVVGVGSPWPGLATEMMARYDMPVEVIAAAEGGSDLVIDWRPGQRLDNSMLEMIAAARVRAIDVAICHIGESGMLRAETTQASYFAEYKNCIDGFHAALPFGAALVVDDELVQSVDLARRDSRIRLTFTYSATDTTYTPGITVRKNMTTGDFMVVTYEPANTRMQLRVYSGVTQSVIKNQTIPALIDGETYTLEVLTRAGTVQAWLNGGTLLKREIDIDEAATVVGQWRYDANGGAVTSFQVDGLGTTRFVIYNTGYYQPDERVTRETADAVRLAELQVADEVAHAWHGPMLYDQPHAFDLSHFRTDREAAIMQRRALPYIFAAVDGVPAVRGPMFLSAARVDDTHTLVTFTVGAGPLTAGASPLIGWRITDDGVAVAITAAVVQPNNVSVLITHGALAGAVRKVSFASGFDGVNATLRDSMDLGLPTIDNGQPAEIFVGKDIV